MTPEDLDEAVRRGETIWPALRGASLFLTGGTGFLGRWLLAVLLHAEDQLGLGLSVTCLSRDPDRFRTHHPALAGHPAVTLCAGDVRFFNYPHGHFTHVIHAAADTSVDADRRPLELIETIVDGTRRVLGFARSVSAKRVLFVSSGAVYGALPAEADSFTETQSGACSTADPAAAYGQAKRLAEQLCTVFRHTYGLKTVVARGFAFAGPEIRLAGHFAFGNFIADAVAGRPIEIKGDGSPVRSYLYAADAAVWLLTMLVKGQAGGIYNVGSPRPVSIAELAGRIGSLLGTDVKILGTPDPAAPRRRYLPDTALAQRELGLEDWTDLDTAIRRTAAWAAARPAEVASPQAPLVPAHKTFVIDIDGVIAGLTPGNDYRLAQPLTDTIAAINRLYDAGHKIVLFTARGSGTGLDWREVTEGQMAAWGVKHHELRLGKPAADYYIDDRLLSPSELQRLGGEA
jgi:dTDP-glucose 4,6-dehydratase